MSALTRILNNQIYNQTIIASQKIQPGSITGTLFASNVTVPGDFLITGNLFVLGSSQTTTVASTNTYVNDPLIVLNNGFAGSNTYDEGLVFNRGTADNKAFIWSETFKEFRLITTAEGGTTYGNITSQLGLANLSVGKFYTSGTNTTAGNIDQVGTGAFGVTVAGNIALNGPYITTSQGNISVFNVGTTQINLGGEANLSIGASVGTTAIRNATLSLPFGTALTTGQTTFSLLNTTATTINFGGEANITLGASGIGITTIRTSNVWVPFGTTLDTAQTTFNLLNNPTTLTAFDSAATLAIGATTGTLTLNNPTVVGSSATQVLYNTVATQIDFGGVANIVMGANVGVSTIRNTTLALPNTSNIWVGASSLTFANTVTGYLGIGGEASLINVGGTSTITNIQGSMVINSTTPSDSYNSGALVIAGGLGVAEDVHILGNLYVSNIYSQQEQIITVKEPLLYLEAANTYPYNYDIGFYSQFTGGVGNIYQHTGFVRDNADSDWKLFSNVAAEPAAGQINFTNAKYDRLVLGNILLKTSGGIVSDTTTTNIVNETATTVNFAGAATALNVGATSGTLTINNPEVVGTQTTQALYNTVTDTLNFARSANITMGHTSGITSLQGAANIQAVTTSTNAGTGALKVQGGVGVRGNLNIAGDTTGIAYSGRGALTVGLDVAAGVLYPENIAQFTSNANSFSRISIQNVSTGQNASSEFVALTNNGSNTSGYIATGIAGINFNSTAFNSIIKPQDGYLVTSAANLVISAFKDIILAAGPGANADVIASATWSNIGVQYNTPASSASTGALTTVGGVGIGTNLYVAKGVTINSTYGNEGFIIFSSKVGNIAIAANVQGIGGTNTESVIIGGGNITLQPGAILKVGGATSMMVPVGPSAARPSSQGANDVAGMLRYNTTVNALEYYDGSAWQIAGSVFTVISDRQFSGNVSGGYGNVDGTNTQFTLQSTATTSGCIVSINGVMQFPVLAYSVSGSTLTFTEPPAPDDVIDVRILTTTSTIGSLANGNGLNQIIADDDGVNIWTGTSDGGTIKRVLVDPAGEINIVQGSKLTYTQQAINIAANNTPYVIATWSKTAYTSAKYVIQAKKDATNMESMEALVLTDGSSSAYVTTYAVVNNGTPMGTLIANVTGSNVTVWYTTTTNMTNANVKAFGTYIV